MKTARRLAALAAGLLTLSIVSPVFSAPGDADPTFGRAGIVKLDLGPPVNFQSAGVATLASGKYVVFGRVQLPWDAVPQFAFGQHVEDGTLDTDIPNGGWRYLAVPGATTLEAIAIARSGTEGIVAVGRVEGNQLALIKANDYIGFDPSFGSSGLVVDASNAMTPHSVGMLPDGRVLVAGQLDGQAAFARYTASGQRDASFGVNGIVLAAYGPNGVVTQVLPVGGAGAFYAVGGGDSALGDADIVIARHLADGSLDPNWAVGGKHVVDIGGAVDRARTLWLDDFNVLMVGGSSGSKAVIIRVRPDNGALYNSTYPFVVDFGPGVEAEVQAFASVAPPFIAAIVLRDVTTGARQLARVQFGFWASIEAQETTGIAIDRLHAGFNVAGQRMRFIGSLAIPGATTMLRVQYAGWQPQIDASFGPGGVQTDVVTLLRYDVGTDFALQPDGKILVAGNAQDHGAVLYRLHPTGWPDLTFGTAGAYRVPGYGNTHAVAALADGRILFGYTTPDLRVVRLLPDGTPDPTWALEYIASYASVSSMAVQPNGRVVLALDNSSAWRLLDSGQVDTSFGVDGQAGVMAGAHVLRDVSQVVVAPSGRLYFSGRDQATGSPAVFALTSAGVADASWGDGGRVALPVSGTATGLALLPNGRLLVSSDCNYSGCVTRLRENGTVDLRFADQGTLTVQNRGFTGVGFDAAGRVLSGGEHSYSSPYFTRRMPGGGWSYESATTPFSYASFSGSRVLVQPDGRGLLLGTLGDGPAAASVVMIRFEGGDGSPVPDPETSFTATPGATSGTSATFAFTDSYASGGFECVLDGGVPYTCASPLVLAGLSGGTHSLSVQAYGPNGEDPTPAVHAWTVDASAPETSIDSGPTGSVASAAASFAFSSPEGGGTFECRLDGAAFAACTSPVSYTSLGEGAHTFAVRARDAAGNVDATPATRTWTIDTVAPDTSISSGPPAATGATDATFAFSATEPGSFECSLDGGAFAACTSPATYTGLAVGSRTFAVRARDAVGNVDATPAQHAWTVLDTTAPQTTISSGPSGPVNSTSATFTFSAGESSTFQCRRDGQAFTACTSPITYTGLAAGAHTFEVRATDTAGNVDATPASRSWTIDVTAPNTTITSGPPNNTTNTSATFAFTSTESGSTFECRLDAGAWVACASPNTISGLSRANHTYTVRAVDAAGNVDATPASYSWRVR